MCGIAGIVRIDGRPVDRQVLGRMAARLAHRGPDDEGYWLGGEAPSPAASVAGSGATPSVFSREPTASALAVGSRLSTHDEGAGAVGLAVRRLAVIDPAGSRQPLANEDGSIRLVCNGEIYNYRDLRAGLAARGHTLRTAGDAEALVHLYEDHGPDLLARLVGMFAFALWDGRRGRLLLARDRLGQKPLYWWQGPAGLVFASEVAALLECPDVPRSLDPRAIGAFLRFGYVPAPATGFAGVRKLPPAHYLVFDAAAGRVDGPTRYWDTPRGPAEAGVSREEWRERLASALAEAVRSQLVADVPLGVLLSGGLDSSAVAALASAAVPGRLRTFTVRFAARGWDESAYAREVAGRFGTEHTEVAVEPRCLEALPELVERHGEPFADSSSIAMYYLAREARRGITVALSGDGGDESFGGYPRHAATILSERMGPGLRRALARLGRAMPPRPGRKSRWNDARRFLAALDLEPLPRYLAWRSLFSFADLSPSGGGGDQQVAPTGMTGAGGAPLSAAGVSRGSAVALLAPDFAAAALADDPLAAWQGALGGLDSRPWVDRAMAIDLVDYLPNDCLAKVDIASMRHGLEVRCPFLDHRVVELARRMPVDLKWRLRRLRMPQGKVILRELFAAPLRIADCGLQIRNEEAAPRAGQSAIRNPQSAIPSLPKSVLLREKMGFGVPVSDWLAGEYAEWMRGILFDGGARSRGLLNRAAVEELVAAHTARRADHGERLWALVCLELWLRAFGV